MKRYRNCVVRRRKLANIRKNKNKRNLRGGSKEVKAILMMQNPHCDICGTGKSLELHHVYLIRHGFQTELGHCVLLCSRCHHDWHVKYDAIWDALYVKNPDTDFMKMYHKTLEV